MIFSNIIGIVSHYLKKNIEIQVLAYAPLARVVDGYSQIFI